jgi:hypothetical protein
MQRRSNEEYRFLLFIVFERLGIPPEVDDRSERSGDQVKTWLKSLEANYFHLSLLSSPEGLLNRIP